jgi:hypothetical protein
VTITTSFATAPAYFLAFTTSRHSSTPLHYNVSGNFRRLLSLSMQFLPANMQNNIVEDFQ